MNTYSVYPEGFSPLIPDLIRPQEAKPASYDHSKGPRKKDGDPLWVAPYKDIGNRYRTESLFLETITGLDPDIYWPLWTLKTEDVILPPSHWYFRRFPKGTIPSLRRIYLQIADPHEHEFAMRVFKSDQQWKAVCSSTKIRDHVDEWRQALELKLKSEGAAILRDMALHGAGPQAIQAARWLAEGGWKTKATKGRPSKDEVSRQVKVEVGIAKTLEADAERIGLSLGDKLMKDSSIG
jgi:hypothetical protein